ncbi:MAG: hypothetical protein JW384_04301 [Nitrosomonadaceae bacterium]|jgi:hypothetical protein|nr:hypothetical protein [Nitrosomonadaceae bacterium]
MAEVFTGSVSVFTSSGRGFNNSELTELLLNRLVAVSEKAPQPIRDQAIAYREAIGKLILPYMDRAVKNDRLVIANKLSALGYPEAAELIRKI